MPTLEDPVRTPPTPTPDPIPLRVGRETLATAYPRRPPGPRETCWSWRMSYRAPGTGARTWRDLGRLQVEAVPAALVAAYREVDPAAVQESGEGITTLAHLLAAWIVAQRARASAPREEHRIAAGTLEGYEDHVRRAGPHGVSIRLATLSPADLDGVRDALSARLAPRTVIVAMGVVRAAVTWGRRRGIVIPDVPWPRARPVKSYTGNRHTPSSDEVEHIYTDLHGDALRLAIYLCWRTGARIGEVRGLAWTDLTQDSDGGWWLHLAGKTGPREFPLAPDEAAEILTYRGRDLGGTGGRIFAATSPNSDMLADALTRRGLTVFTFHGLRRAFTDLCLRRGVDVGTYAALTGHSPQVALTHYRVATREDKRAAVARARGGAAPAVGILAWLSEHGLSETDAIQILSVHLPART